MSSVATKPSPARDELLCKKYYCKYDHAKNEMELIVEVAASDEIKENLVENHYALVVDVSDSMGSTKVDNMTLLDHLKVFCAVLIDELPDNSSLSIVAFSHFAEVKLPMTAMTSSGKIKAKETVKGLHCCGGTNISDGLYVALDTIKRSSRARGSIILFTDGDANAGDKHAKKIVRRYKQKIRENERISSVPISTITVGRYRPELLVQLSKELGSDAFYWLEMKDDFEADMLLPLWLRQSSFITDVSINITGLENTRIIEHSKHFVIENESSKNGGNSAKFFIHSLPQSLQRNLRLLLQLTPKKTLESGTKILKIEAQFLDHKATLQKETEDFIYLQTKTMQEAAEAEGKKKVDLDSTKSSYYVNSSDVTWKEGKVVMSKICRENFRISTVNCMNEICAIQVPEPMTEQHTKDMKDNLHAIAEKYKKEMQVTKQTHQANFGETNTRKIEESYRHHLNLIDHGLKTFRNNEWAKLQAVATSLSAESPNVKGVFFDGERHFLPSHIAHKLKQTVKEVKSIKKSSKPKATEKKMKAESPIQSKPKEKLVKKEADESISGEEAKTQLKVDFVYPAGKAKKAEKKVEAKQEQQEEVAANTGEDNKKKVENQINKQVAGVATKSQTVENIIIPPPNITKVEAAKEEEKPKVEEKLKVEEKPKIEEKIKVVEKPIVVVKAILEEGLKQKVEPAETTTTKTVKVNEKKKSEVTTAKKQEAKKPEPKRIAAPKEVKKPVAANQIEKVKAVASKKVAPVKAPPKIFKAKNIVLSESLMTKKVAGQSKTVNETIIQLGATPVPHVATFTQNTFLISSLKDFKRESGKIRDAKNKKIPIVKEKFLYDCIEKKAMVEMGPYTLFPPTATAAVTVQNN